MKRRLLPDGMLQRMPAMLVWLLALSFTSLARPELGATTAVGGIVGIGLGLLLYVMWGDRTRPKRNAFWFFVHIVLLAGIVALTAARPLLGIIAAVPVTLLWLHDAPSSPTSMLGWGTVVLLFQPEEFWRSAEDEQAWNVLVGMMLFIMAAQFERNRLAARQFAQAGFTYSVFRLVAVAGVSLLVVASRDSLRVVNVFTNLGIDASGETGQLAMLGIVVLCIAVAVALFRVRPPRQAPVLVDAAPRTAKRGDPEAVDPRAGAIDFDDDTPIRGGGTKRSGTARVGAGGAGSPRSAGQARRSTKSPATDRARSPARSPRSEAPRKRRPSQDEAAQPGELDFD